MHIPTTIGRSLESVPLKTEEIAIWQKAAEVIHAGGAGVDKAERLMRQWLRGRMLAWVESVSWMRRMHGTEFVVLVLPTEASDARRYARHMEEILELVTAPGSPLEISREQVGKHDTRVYLRLAKPSN